MSVWRVGNSADCVRPRGITHSYPSPFTLRPPTPRQCHTEDGWVTGDVIPPVAGVFLGQVEEEAGASYHEPVFLASPCGSRHQRQIGTCARHQAGRTQPRVNKARTQLHLQSARFAQGRFRAQRVRPLTMYGCIMGPSHSGVDFDTEVQKTAGAQ
ncbi:hypothetical protein NDU88_003031 [Pleurodeles waltl]|uniref:Uncharacterized protein n=1 Tax=Pleurodeles waltl TaxID=8319 RepID=A0AAV7MQH1_PLEWA|nr:hypothetical protein NDU88_003031 [Pleurodeles waltl]